VGEGGGGGRLGRCGVWGGCAGAADGRRGRRADRGVLGELGAAGQGVASERVGCRAGGRGRCARAAVGEGVARRGQATGGGRACHRRRGCRAVVRHLTHEAHTRRAEGGIDELAGGVTAGGEDESLAQHRVGLAEDRVGAGLRGGGELRLRLLHVLRAVHSLHHVAGRRGGDVFRVQQVVGVAGVAQVQLDHAVAEVLLGDGVQGAASARGAGVKRPSMADPIEQDELVERRRRAPGPVVPLLELA
jgi:hypothetical protein